MRAAVLYEALSPMSIEDVSLDGPRDDEVLVQVRATGACHSDYHVIDGTWHGPGYPMPIILGHEAVLKRIIRIATIQEIAVVQAQDAR